MSDQFLDGLLLLLGNAALAVLTALLSAATGWIVGKIKNQRAQAVISQLDDLALTVVRSTYQAYVKPLQAANAWTPEAHAQAKQRAMEELKSYLGSRGIAELHKVVGGDLGAFLGAVVDEAVHNNKLFGAAMKAPAPLMASAQG